MMEDIESAHDTQVSQSISIQAEENSQGIVDELDGSSLLAEILGEALSQCVLFHVKLQKEGLLRGLVGPRDMGILWERHILNSAAVVPFIRAAVEKSKQKRVADVGSGGGFPGLVVAACLPDYDVTLIEPMERRVDWLRECVALMGLNNVTIFHGRSDEVIEKIKSHTIPPFDVVTCRAVAPMTKLAGWTIPLLKTHGSLIALKGKSAQTEVEKAAKMIRKAGGINPRILEAPVAPGLQPTTVVIVDKA